LVGAGIAAVEESGLKDRRALGEPPFIRQDMVIAEDVDAAAVFDQRAEGAGHDKLVGRVAEADRAARLGRPDFHARVGYHRRRLQTLAKGPKDADLFDIDRITRHRLGQPVLFGDSVFQVLGANEDFDGGDAGGLIAFPHFAVPTPDDIMLGRRA